MYQQENDRNGGENGWYKPGSIQHNGNDQNGHEPNQQGCNGNQNDPNGVGNYQNNGENNNQKFGKNQWAIIAIILAAVVALTVVFLIGGMQSDSDNGQTPPDSMDTQKHPEDECVTAFLVEYFTGKSQWDDAGVPSQICDYFEEEWDNSEYAGAKVLEIYIKPGRRITKSMAERIAEYYLDKTGIWLEIQDGYIYAWSVTVEFPDGRISIDNDGPSELKAVKIDGQWFVLPDDDRWNM